MVVRATIVVVVGGVGGRGGFDHRLGYVLIELIWVVAVGGGCDGCGKDGKGDETDHYEYAGRGDFSFVCEKPEIGKVR